MDRTARLQGIDFLRGLVMILMVLDHSRDFFGDMRINPEDLDATTVGLFFTRWVTHFCAPVFVFLAGTSAWLYQQKSQSVGAVSRFLITRGLWLVLLELTVVQFAWTGSFLVPLRLIQVIAAIGFGMIALAGFVWLPWQVSLAVGALLVVGHNATDVLEASQFGSGWWMWKIAQEGNRVGGPLPFVEIGLPILLGGGTRLYLLWFYPILPWLGVMALGYAFGKVMNESVEWRRRFCWKVGVAATLLFLVLRASNLYGDPHWFSLQETWQKTLMCFFVCEKYPPSLMFLLMTLGPSLMLLSVVDRKHDGWTQMIVTFGRVPLFFYLLHLVLLCQASALHYRWRTGEWFYALAAQFQGQPPPEGYGNSLVWVYGAWAVTIVLLYPICRWYARLKRRSQSRWLSYL